MKAVLIDDENKARRLLEALLLGECPRITKIYQASNLQDGIEIIHKETPDIVFLDIEMPKHSGLEILDFFKNEKVNFQIIFVTAYNQYAIDAFKLSAVDYLLKPVQVVELQKATEKAIKLVEEKSVNTQLIELKKVFKQMALSKIAIEVPKGIRFVAIDEIQFFEADGMYTKVYLNDGTTELICKPLKHFVTQLENKAVFYKPHRSYLVNLKHIIEFVKKDGFYLLFANNKTVPISKEKKAEFLQLVQEMF